MKDRNIMLIRNFVPSDLDAVCRIEVESFPLPWSSSTFIYFHRTYPDLFKVAVENGVIGYGIATIEVRKRICGHLVNLAVSKKERRKGIGKALTESILKDLSGRGISDVYLEVRTSNMIARKFYKAMGFSESGIVRNYYIWEDAIIMRRKL